jgi:hypothetical protein
MGNSFFKDSICNNVFYGTIHHMSTDNIISIIAREDGIVYNYAIIDD